MYDTTKPYTRKILDLIKQTWETEHVSVENGFVRKKFHLNEYHHTDGIGTKGVYHWKNKSFKNAVIDAMAMNLNDLAMNRAKPYAVIDHLFVPEDNEEAIANTIKYLTEECKRRDIAITGGETAIHDNMEGMELSITMLGVIKNAKENLLKDGDILIGLESNGLHSNGFTKIREIFSEEYREEFIKPTYIYSDKILEIDNNYNVHGMMHITGGSFTKLKSLIRNLDIEIGEHNLNPQKIFYEIYEKIDDEEIYKTFNCGIGFVIGIGEKNAEECLSEIKKDFKADVIGKVVTGSGKIKIKSKFSDKEIIY